MENVSVRLSTKTATKRDLMTLSLCGIGIENVIKGDAWFRNGYLIRITPNL